MTQKRLEKNEILVVIKKPIRTKFKNQSPNRLNNLLFHNNIINLIFYINFFHNSFSF